MPRATTKDELLKMADAQFSKLFATVDAMSGDVQDAPFCFDAAKAGSEAHWSRDKNLRDVLIHLYEWHGLLLAWEDSNARGTAKPFLPEPYNWKTYGALNEKIWERHAACRSKRNAERKSPKGIDGHTKIHGRAIIHQSFLSMDGDVESRAVLYFRDGESLRVGNQKTKRKRKGSQGKIII